MYPAQAYEPCRSNQTIRRRWIPWATMLLKVFAVDVLACSNCQSRMQRIAWITQPRVITIRQEWRIGRKRGAIAARRKQRFACEGKGTEGARVNAILACVEVKPQPP